MSTLDDSDMKSMEVHCPENDLRPIRKDFESFGG